MRPFQYKKPLNTGDFRNRICIEQPVVIKDELNQVIETSWQEVKKAWSMIKTVKGSEYIEASASQATRIYRFVIPYTSGITEEMRVNMKNRIFDIIEPPMNDDEMYQTLTIIAKEHT
ncbi:MULTISPECIES: phage head closure protein [Bacillus cereus group]|uniref:phage head closure protein n=1 Tax=Bacillus cereus group TaxID=86661 RepID=UPI000BEE7E33|nr:MULTISPECIES: phage head closure protein [Bacillus cereus group]MBJ8100956.1 phage head closure protein [Bacillus cereus group sp. N11]MCG3793661.1 phage head closure protein [Bacillus toyonensis]PDZ85022.1 head-tail adaptor protein [Bacillus toyonensis]PEA72739.1 head-tail adaptor protein [Bacillus toyonensis]PEE83474.1 head-tail adaptor protein [Bacillus toyonensis]